MTVSFASLPRLLLSEVAILFLRILILGHLPGWYMLVIVYAKRKKTITKMLQVIIILDKFQKSFFLMKIFAKIFFYGIINTIKVILSVSLKIVDVFMEPV